MKANFRLVPKNAVYNGCSVHIKESTKLQAARFAPYAKIRINSF